MNKSEWTEEDEARLREVDEAYRQFMETMDWLQNEMKRYQETKDDERTNKETDNGSE